MKNHAFIDSNNLYLGIKSLNWEMDYKKLRIYLRDKYDVETAFLFLGYIPGNEKLYKKLEKFGYTIIFKPIVIGYQKGKVITKGNTDAELVLHCAKGLFLKQFKQALIITGDGDFYCLVEELVSQGKLRRLLVPNRRSYSQLLQDFRSETDFLDKLAEKLGTKNAGVALGTNPKGLPR